MNLIISFHHLFFSKKLIFFGWKNMKFKSKIIHKKWIEILSNRFLDLAFFLNFVWKTKNTPGKVFKWNNSVSKKIEITKWIKRSHKLNQQVKSWLGWKIELNNRPGKTSAIWRSIFEKKIKTTLTNVFPELLLILNY